MTSAKRSARNRERLLGPWGPAVPERFPRIVGDQSAGLWETSRLWKTGDAGVIFLSGPIGAGKTAVARALLPLLAAPLFYIEGDTFWSFINKRGDCGFAFRRPVNRMGQRKSRIPAMVSTPQETGTRATLVIRHGHPGAEQIMPPPERPPERSHRRARTGVPAHSRGTIATDRRGGRNPKPKERRSMLTAALSLCA